MSKDNTQLPAELLEAIEMKAEHEAALHFHPLHSRDQNTACRICYRNGAKEYAISLHQAEQELGKMRTLLEKVISRHEGGLLPDRLLYNEIKTFLDGTK